MPTHRLSAILLQHRWRLMPLEHSHKGGAMSTCKFALTRTACSDNTLAIYS